ncbi:hypothetical protein FACS189430_04840 [Bacteroidia bacterium]|nr:hypothetical protein FACS189430_04840 [Bacteroidia bacterium]
MRAQDTEFWFVTPSLSSIYNIPTYFVITAGNAEAVVTMEMPAFSGFAIPAAVPIGYPDNPASKTFTVPANSSVQVSFGTAANMNQFLYDYGSLPGTGAASGPVGGISTKGIHFTSTANVTIFFQEDKDNSKDMFALKGSKALGTEFYTPFQTTYVSTGYTGAFPQFLIVATKNNTKVTITPKANIADPENIAGKSNGIWPAGEKHTITLNKGETYMARQYTFSQTNQRLAGSHITSDSLIAVTIADDLLNLGGAADVAGDQIVPVNNLGTGYIAVKGFKTTNGGDNIYVLATQNGTNIYLNGSTTPANPAPLNAGEQYTYVLSAETSLINTNKPVYVWQLSGNGGEVGSVLLPSMYSINAQSISFNRLSSQANGQIFVLVQKGGEDRFLVNNNAALLPSSKFNDVPGTNGEWKYARTGIDTWPYGVMKVFNSKAAFALAYFYGSGSCSFGYFTGYGGKEFASTTWRCTPNSTVTLDGGYGSSYYWTLPPGVTLPAPNGEYPDPLHPTIRSIVTTLDGEYSVVVDQDPFLVTATTTIATRTGNDVIINVSDAPTGTHKIGAGDATYTVALTGDWGIDPSSPDVQVHYQWRLNDAIVGGDADTYQKHWEDGEAGRITVLVNTEICAVEKEAPIHWKQPHIFVKQGGAGTMDGSSWENAYSDLAEALAMAHESNGAITEIWVTKGVYHPKNKPFNGDTEATSNDPRDVTFTLRDNLKIYGGFPFDATSAVNKTINDRDWGANPTILSGELGLSGNGDNAYHVVTAIDVNNTAILDGFIISDGNADGAGTLDVGN